MLNRVLLPVNRAPFEHARRLTRSPAGSCRQTGFHGKSRPWAQTNRIFATLHWRKYASGAKYLNAAPIQQQLFQRLRRIDDGVRAALLQQGARAEAPRHADCAAARVFSGQYILRAVAHHDALPG